MVFSILVGIISCLLGAGGGILIVPFLIFLRRYPVKNSAGAVSFIVIFSSLFGVFGHLTSGGFDLLLIAGTAIAVIIGATIGARSMVKISGGHQGRIRHYSLGICNPAHHQAYTFPLMFFQIYREGGRDDPQTQRD